MILVAGGTGRLGTVLVRRLTDRGLAVGVLTRDRARATHLQSPHLTVFVGDVREPSSLAAAAVGAHVIVSAVHGFVGTGGVTPQNIDRDGNRNLTDAAREQGAEVVLVSVAGASAESPLELVRMKHEAEQYLQASGVPSTIVRATAFLELWVDLMHRTSSSRGRPLVFGRGENPVNFVSVTDVAALIDRAVTDPSTRGATLEIGGPENLTFNQLAAMVMATSGTTGKPRHVPPAMLRAMATTVGRLKPQLGRQMRSALAMDSADLAFDAAPIHRQYPDLPLTPVESAMS